MLDPVNSLRNSPPPTSSCENQEMITSQHVVPPLIRIDTSSCGNSKHVRSSSSSTNGSSSSSNESFLTSVHEPPLTTSCRTRRRRKRRIITGMGDENRAIQSSCCTYLMSCSTPMSDYSSTSSHGGSASTTSSSGHGSGMNQIELMMIGSEEVDEDEEFSPFLYLGDIESHSTRRIVRSSVLVDDDNTHNSQQQLLAKGADEDQQRNLQLPQDDSEYLLLLTATALGTECSGISTQSRSLSGDTNTTSAQGSSPMSPVSFVSSMESQSPSQSETLITTAAATSNDGSIVMINDRNDGSPMIDTEIIDNTQKYDSKENPKDQLSEVSNDEQFINHTVPMESITSNSSCQNYNNRRGSTSQDTLEIISGFEKWSPYSNDRQSYREHQRRRSNDDLFQSIMDNLNRSFDKDCSTSIRPHNYLEQQPPSPPPTPSDVIVIQQQEENDRRSRQGTEDQDLRKQQEQFEQSEAMKCLMSMMSMVSSCQPPGNYEQFSSQQQHTAPTNFIEAPIITTQPVTDNSKRGQSAERPASLPVETLPNIAIPTIRISSSSPPPILPSLPSLVPDTIFPPQVQIPIGQQLTRNEVLYPSTSIQPIITRNLDQVTVYPVHPNPREVSISIPRSRSTGGVQKPEPKMRKYFNLDDKLHVFHPEEHMKTPQLHETTTLSSSNSSKDDQLVQQAVPKATRRKRGVKFFNNEFNLFVQGTHKTQQRVSRGEIKFTKMYW